MLGGPGGKLAARDMAGHSWKGTGGNLGHASHSEL